MYGCAPNDANALLSAHTPTHPPPSPGAQVVFDLDWYMSPLVSLMGVTPRLLEGLTAYMFMCMALYAALLAIAHCASEGPLPNDVWYTCMHPACMHPYHAMHGRPTQV